ncbi:MAG: phosphatidate cytidylyltransferase [Hyphomicrobium sp.]|nr:phosphatidate cytidylyltransferase [Hyphomicrobium sp.]
MLLDGETFRVFAAVLAVLTVASLTGFILSRKASGGPAHATIENLNARIKSWWVMVGALAAAFAFGKTGLIVLFALCSFMALREFLTIAPTHRGDHGALFAAFFAVLPIQYYLIGIEWYGLFSIFIPVYAFLLLPALSILRGDTENFMERISETQWGLMTCVFCLSHVPALVTLDIPGYSGRQILLVAFLIIVVQGSDVLQYMWGKLYGAHKIAPNVSPSKTVEGLVGGAVSATLLGAALYGITPFTSLQAAGMAGVIVLMGFVGGLVMSAIKRDRGVKDWGEIIQGHGGMLDRMDSLVFSAPVFFHLIRYWFTV